MRLKKSLSALISEIDIPVKALINNAGIGRMGFLEQLSVKDIRLVMDTNLTSQVIVTKAFLPLLKKQGEGDILFMGSEAALKGARQGSIYCASKFAVRGFSQALTRGVWQVRGQGDAYQSGCGTYAILREIAVRAGACPGKRNRA